MRFIIALHNDLKFDAMRFLRFATALGFAAWLAKNDGVCYMVLGLAAAMPPLTPISQYNTSFRPKGEICSFCVPQVRRTYISITPCKFTQHGDYNTSPQPPPKEGEIELLRSS